MSNVLANGKRTSFVLSAGDLVTIAGNCEVSTQYENTSRLQKNPVGVGPFEVDVMVLIIATASVTYDIFTGVGTTLISISDAQLADPPQGLIDNMSGVYITPDGARYVSNGTALIQSVASTGFDYYVRSYYPALTQKFAMDVRTAVAIPVPCVRPETVNTAIALDICPNGTPAEFGTNGVAWLDICDSDVKTGVVPVAVARVGMRSGFAEFGCRAFDGGTLKPVIIAMNGVSGIQLATNFNVTVGDSTGVDGQRFMLLTNPFAGTAAYADFSVKGSNAAQITMRNFSATFAYDGGNYANVGEILAVGSAKLFLTGPNGIYFNLSTPFSTGNIGSFTTGLFSVVGAVKTAGYTVATLPAASGALAGARAYVTDALLPTYLGALTGGGAVVCPVFCNGAAWVSA